MLEAVFFDRDGVINVDYGYVYRTEDFEIVTGFEQFYKLLPNSAKKLIVTNQSGIARGYFGEGDLNTFMNYLFSKFALRDIFFSDWAYCPHHPEFNGSCICRKPEPGLINKLLQKYSLNPMNCLMVGDKYTDCTAAMRAGIMKIIFVPKTPDELIALQNDEAFESANILICKDFKNSLSDLEKFVRNV